MEANWTEDENRRMIAEFPIVGAPKMAARLCKTIYSTRKQARQLGLKWSKPIVWKGKRLKQLADDYYSIGGPATTLKYGISGSYIRELIFKAGLQRRNWKWQPSEDKVIITLYPSAPYSEILAKLPGRTVMAIRSRAAFLGVRRPNMRFKEVWKYGD